VVCVNVAPRTRMQMPRALLYSLCWIFFIGVFPARAVLRLREVSKSKDDGTETDQSALPLSSEVSTLQKSGNGNPQFKEAIVVTLHKMTPGVRLLLDKLYGSLAGGKRALWALVDGKRATPGMLWEIGNAIKHRNHVLTVDYQSMLHKVFPYATPKQKRNFDIFEGIHQAPAKPGAIWFLAEGPGAWYDHVWVIESDVRFVQGNWLRVFNSYSQHRSDLISVIDLPKRWGNWGKCTHPGCKKAHRQRSFLPVFRISKRLAQDVLFNLRAGYTGHHEAFLHAVCKEERRWHCWTEDLEHSPLYGKITYRKPLPRKLTRGKLYHPIKSALLSTDDS